MPSAAIGNSPRQRIDRFLASPAYILAVMVLTALSNFFSLELAVYTVFVVIAVYVCLAGSDLLPMIPLVLCAYLAPSVGNNPGRNGASVFSLQQGGIYLICLAAVLIIALIFHVIKNASAFFRKERALLNGILLLTGAYLLSGIGSAGYTAIAGKNLLFSLIQGLAILLPYWLFSGGVKWDAARRDYFAWVGFGAGCLLVCQVLWIYCTASVIVGGVIDRSQIFTGWGIHNNLGGILAMMIPFAFYLAAKYRKGWLGTVAGSVFLIGVVLTCSRSSILVGFAIYILCALLMLQYASNRRENMIALLTVAAVLLFGLLLFRRQILRLFSALLLQGMDPSSRDLIYMDGLQLFVDNPFFGVSFYPPKGMSWSWSTAEGFLSFFPPRWHNTLIQLLASCGIVGFGAYLYHRAQTTLLLLLRRRTRETLFIGCSVLVLLVTSLLDCHLFNIGPALFYAMALAFAENIMPAK